MKLLDEIREQPLHIRKIFMWSLVIITFSLFGYWRLHAISQHAVALINPKSQAAPALARQDTSRSPFALIGDSLSSLRASISDLLKGTASQGPNPALRQTTQVPPRPQQLP